MVSTFRPVNSPLAEVPREDASATTPSATTPSLSPDATANSHAHLHAKYHADDATTPTRTSFQASARGQKPLPSSPFPQAAHLPETSDWPRRDNSQHSAKSPRRNSSDVDMDESDGDTGTVDENGASDDESVNADGSRSGKKKKSQRFYCTDFPPCNLSFTRSEHLARHIRKHTGERPFQCHCMRRFSRLDNLRQHAQTVHVNEDIPIDSLAATGSRFQRQIRTERVRQIGNRARATTSGSAGGPIRGHSKSLSTSSINSIGSVGSAYSAQTDAARRRPPPLVMAAGDARSRGSLESYRSNADSAYSSYRPPSPSDFSTPTSATFSTGQSSPRWSGFATPASSHSRSHSAYVAGARTPGRRLSVPSGANPFQSHGHPPHHLYGAAPINTSNVGAYSPSGGVAQAPSPTASTASGWSARRDSTSSATDEAWRRRTWHPDSRSYGSASQLSAVVKQSTARPDPPPPMASASSSQANSQSTLRLPGIESFDLMPRCPMTPPGRVLSPMVIDSEHAPRSAPHRHPSSAGLASTPIDERRNLNMYDASLQRGLHRLDIGPNSSPRDSAGAWASEVNQAVQAQAEQVRMNPPTVRFEDQQPRSSYHPQQHYPNPAAASRSLHQQTMSAPSATTREARRHGWYQGPPPAAVRDGGYQDPRVNQVDRMVHPNFNGFNGFPGREPATAASQGQSHQPPERQTPRNGEPLGRLETLVAVATGEGSTAAAY